MPHFNEKTFVTCFSRKKTGKFEITSNKSVSCAQHSYFSVSGGLWLNGYCTQIPSDISSHLWSAIPQLYDQESECSVSTQREGRVPPLGRHAWAQLQKTLLTDSPSCLPAAQYCTAQLGTITDLSKYPPKFRQSQNMHKCAQNEKSPLQ